jgi:hypothetical protein
MLNLWNPDSDNQVESDQRPIPKCTTPEERDNFSCCEGMPYCAICKYIDTGEEDEQILGKLPTAAEIDRFLSTE